MASPLEMVRAFHERFGIPVREVPQLPSSEIRDLRVRLLREEVEEYLVGESSGDLPNIAHELADILYVVYGTAAAYGIPLDEVFAEVHRANMSKSPAREGGKPVKGPSFKGADVASVLRRQI